jgi:hypothetical protein
MGHTTGQLGYLAPASRPRRSPDGYVGSATGAGRVIGNRAPQAEPCWRSPVRAGSAPAGRANLPGVGGRPERGWCGDLGADRDRGMGDPVGDRCDRAAAGGPAVHPERGCVQAGRPPRLKWRRPQRGRAAAMAEPAGDGSDVDAARDQLGSRVMAQPVNRRSDAQPGSEPRVAPSHAPGPRWVEPSMAAEKMKASEGRSKPRAAHWFIRLWRP